MRTTPLGIGLVLLAASAMADPPVLLSPGLV